MMSRHARFLQIAILLTGWTVPLRGQAATMEAIKAADGANVVVLSGELIRGDDEWFATLAGGIPGDATVVLTSPGGNLVTGLRIGSTIRMRGWRTAVPDSSTYASACGLVWLGGFQRTVGRGARIGFHAAYIENPKRNKAGDWVRKRRGRFVPWQAGPDGLGSVVSHVSLTRERGMVDRGDSPGNRDPGRVRVRRRGGFGEHLACSGLAGAEPSPPPVQPIGSDPALVRQLYSGFPASMRMKDGETCVDRACKVRVLGADTWIGADGAERRTVVTIAEVKDDCHECAAILGLGQFRRTSAADP